MLIPTAGQVMAAAGGNPNQRIILIQNPIRGATGNTGTMQISNSQTAGVQAQQVYVLKQPGNPQQQVILINNGVVNVVSKRLPIN